MRLPLLMFGLCVVLGVASCPQQVPNAMDCTNDDTICTSQGLVCDSRLHECVIVDGCITNAMCSSPSAPICEANACGACKQDDDCADWSKVHNAAPLRNYCISTSLSPQKTCTECRPAMKGADCLDLSNPACDPQLGLCRPCRADNECASGICRKFGDYPATSPIPGLMVGQCIPEDEVAYVDQDAANCMDTGNASSPTTAFCGIDAAINTGKTYVHVAASRALYSGFTINQPGRTIILVGPQNDGRQYSYVQSVAVTAGTVVISNFYFLEPSLIPAAVTCTGQGSSVYVSKSTFYNQMSLGIRFVDASADCGQITVDRAIVNCLNSKKYGVVVGGTGTLQTNYHIVNSVMIGCGTGTTEAAAVQLNKPAVGYFGFNFIIQNNLAVKCLDNQLVDNSLIVNNPGSGAAQVSGCNLDSHNVLDINDIDLSTLPFLQDNSEKNSMNVVDKGHAPPADHPVPFDYDGNPRPQGGDYDIGMQELR